MRHLICLLILALTALVRALDFPVTPPSNTVPDISPYISKAFVAAEAFGPGNRVVLPTPPSGHPWIMLTGVLVQPLSGQQFCSVDFYFHGDHDSLQSQVAGDAFRMLGLKTSCWSVRGLSLSVPISRGIHVDGNQTYQSTSNNRFEFCQIEATAQGCIGYEGGSSTSNDVSGLVYDQCSFETAWLASDIPTVHKNACCGFQFVGYNTLQIALRDCVVSGADVMVSQVAAGLPSGGNGLLISGLGGSNNVLCVAGDGGYNLTWDGGRVENGQALALFGPSGVVGSGQGNVTIRNVLAEGFNSYWPTNWTSPYTDSGVFVQVNSHQNVSIEALSGNAASNTFAYGVGVRSFGAGAGPTISVLRCAPSMSAVKAIEGSFVGATTSGQ